MSAVENKEFSNINTTNRASSQIYENISDILRPSKSYSTINQNRKEKNNKYDDLIPSPAKKNRTFRIIVTTAVTVLIFVIVIVGIILGVLAGTSKFIKLYLP